MWEYADNEVHITADVAFGVMHYYLASGDEKFLFDKGVENSAGNFQIFRSDRVDKRRRWQVSSFECDGAG